MNAPSPSLRSAWLLCAVFASLCPEHCARAQEPAAPPETAPFPRPASGLLDTAAVFDGPDRAVTLNALSEFARKAGLPLFIVTARGLGGEPLETFGQRILQQWLGVQPGIVMVYESQSGQLHFSATPDPGRSRTQLEALLRSGSTAGAAMPPETGAAPRLLKVVTALAAAGARENAPPEPALPPLDFVSDPANAFDPAEEEALKTALLKSHSLHDIDLYVLTFAALPGTTAQQQAETMAAAWLKNRPGAVLAFNRAAPRGEESLGIATGMATESTPSARAFATAAARARETASDIHSSPQGSLAASLHAAATVLTEAFAPAPAPAPPEQPRNRLSLAAAALLSATLLLYFFHRLRERRARRPREQFFFPGVTAGRRLGAPAGGGVIASLTAPELPGPPPAPRRQTRHGR